MVEFFASRTIFLTIGNMHIYWYGVMYVFAFWVAYVLLPFLGKKQGVILSRDQWTNIVAFGAMGVLLGGRIGYALFYDPLFFLAHPVELFQIWHGGMSSHGGFIGAALGVWVAMRNFSLSYEGEREGVSVLAIADCIVPVAALGLALGRIGNIINQEFGIYPYYEAAGDVLIAVVCYALLRSSSRVPFPRIGGKVRMGADHNATAAPTPSLPLNRERGTTFAIFLLLYGIQRFLLEYIRPQDWPLIFGLSRGQILTIPILFIAVLLLHRAYKRRI